MQAVQQRAVHFAGQPVLANMRCSCGCAQQTLSQMLQDCTQQAAFHVLSICGSLGMHHLLGGQYPGAYVCVHIPLYSCNHTHVQVVSVDELSNVVEHRLGCSPNFKYF